jgi:hypothetical protein
LEQIAAAVIVNEIVRQHSLKRSIIPKQHG